MRFLILMAFFLGSFSTLSMPVPAAAIEVDKRVHHYGCHRTNVRKWIGRYSGSTQDFWDRHVVYSFKGCFKSNRQCKRWLSWIDPISQGPIHHRSCKRG